MVERDLWLVFEGNVIVRLFSELFSVSSEAIDFLIDPYNKVLTYLMIHTHKYIYTYIKNFAWEYQRQKQCYIVHIAQNDKYVLCVHHEFYETEILQAILIYFPK